MHLRISHLIMITEGLLLEQGYVKGMEQTTKKRFSKISFNSSSQDYQNLNEVLTTMYSIRHGITHKGQRKIIDIEKFTIFQIKLVELIVKLIQFNQTIKTKDDLIIF